jgi:hypothetical protein
MNADRRVGSVDVLYLGHRVKTLGLVTTSAVPGAGLVKRVTDDLGPTLTALALALVLVGGLLVGFRLRTLFGRRPESVSSR